MTTELEARIAAAIDKCDEALAVLPAHRPVLTPADRTTARSRIESARNLLDLAARSLFPAGRS